MNEEKAMQTVNNEPTQLVEAQQSAALVSGNVWQDKAAFNQLLRASQMLSQSSLVPQNYQGKPQDCFIAAEMAARMNTSPIFVMQNLYVVKGKPSWAGQACAAMINACGKFRNGKPIYVGQKGTDSRGCYFAAERIEDGEIVEGTEVNMQMAKSEGWTSNPKWRNMPEQMLAYRAAAFFARVYCPEALMGLQTYEEVMDVQPREKSGAEELTNALKGDEA